MPVLNQPGNALGRLCAVLFCVVLFFFFMFQVHVFSLATVVLSASQHSAEVLPRSRFETR